ncbi:hypothetical protein PG997_012974 [Apiospora hydei]|uniref:Calcineurin-like phosphoesterase domain-containing protein n=1 Tax=Apiospora hydei TaxID=1337664 RepID=A0ABR1V4V5_9PEZI
MAPVIRFLILSDTHNSSFPDPTSLPTVDVVLHCGDMTMAGGLSNYHSAMSSLQQIDAELKLVIAGNHDLELDSSWWLTNLDEDDDPDEPCKALEVMRSGRDRGIHYWRKECIGSRSNPAPPFRSMRLRTRPSSTGTPLPTDPAMTGSMSEARRRIPSPPTSISS